MRWAHRYWHDAVCSCVVILTSVQCELSSLRDIVSSSLGVLGLLISPSLIHPSIPRHVDVSSSIHRLVLRSAILIRVDLKAAYERRIFRRSDLVLQQRHRERCAECAARSDPAAIAPVRGGLVGLDIGHDRRVRDGLRRLHRRAESRAGLVGASCDGCECNARRTRCARRTAIQAGRAVAATNRATKTGQIEGAVRRRHASTGQAETKVCACEDRSELLGIYRWRIVVHVDFWRNWRRKRQRQ